MGTTKVPGGQISRSKMRQERSLRDLEVRCQGDTIGDLELGPARVLLRAEPAEADLGCVPRSGHEGGTREGN